VKRYEGLFILNTAGKEEGIKELIDKITAEINRLGGRVETVQKMDKRTFSRVTHKNLTAGFYVNMIFEVRPDALAPLRKVFSLNEEIMRVIFTIAPPPKPQTQPQPVAV
jgi:ribosomal protein S6